MTQDAIEQFDTTRLVAKRISLADFPDIHRLHSDPQVMKTLSADGKPLAEATTKDHIQHAIEHWEEHGFGFWVFHRKTDGQFIGRGGLKTYEIDGHDVIGLAYAVIPEYWKQGFATEMSNAILEVGFGQLGFDEIGSWTLPMNLVSQRVMEKLGFTYERDFEFAGLNHRCYRMSVREWAKKRNQA